MNFKLFLTLLTAALFFASCETDICNQTVTYTKATAVYEKIDDLRDTPINGAVRDIENPGKIYVAGDFLLIGEEGEGIHVIDNSDVVNPTAVNFINIPMNREFIVDGNHIYAESQYDMMKIDITDINSAKLESRAEDFIPNNLVNDKGETLVGFDFEDVTETLPCDTPINPDVINYVAWNNELIPPSSVPSSFSGSSNGTSGTLNKLALANGHLYAISDKSLNVLQNGSELRKVNRLENFDDGMETIILRDEELFIGKFDGMTIVDISSPAAPVITREYWHQEACDPVLPYLDVAYVTLRVDGCRGRQNLLDVVDLTGTGSRLSAIERIEMESPYGMSIIDETLYVGEGISGLKMFDISTPESPELISWNQDVEAYDIIQHPTKDIILLAGPDGLNIYENNEASVLTLVSTISF